MLPQCVLFSVVFAALANPADQSTSVEKLRSDLMEVEMTIAQFQRVIPPGFDLASERKAIDNLAAKAELSPIDVKPLGSERLLLPDGKPAPIDVNRLELAGQGSYGAVHFFLSMQRHQARLVGVESARLVAGPGDSVRFVVHLMVPSWANALPEKETPASDVLGEYRKALARNRAILNSIVAMLDRAHSNALEALSLFTQTAGEHAIALTTVQVDDGLSIQGFVLGAEAKAALATSLEKAKLHTDRLDWSRAGVCQGFSLTAHSVPAGQEESFTSGRAVFDGDSARFCRGEPRSPARRLVVRGAASTRDDAFFLRLRGVDFTDVFFVLNDLIGEDYVVDSDVKGPVDVDILEGATIEEVVQALGTAGVVVGAGPLRPVCRTKPAMQRAQHASAAGEPINVSLRDADLASVLCLLGQFSGREIKMSREQQRHLSLFATELPVGVALDQLAPAAGAKGVDPCTLSDRPGSRLSNYQLKIEQMGIDDLRIAGLAHVGDTWRAYVFGPTKRLMAIEAAQPLYDGTVTSIESNSITFSSASNARVVRLVQSDRDQY